MSEFEYKIMDDETGKYALVNLSESVLGGFQAMEFSQALDSISEDNINRIIIDMSRVNIINSSGIGMIAGAFRELKAKDCELMLTNVPEPVIKLLVMTRLDKVIKIV